jgi:pilus assembly protein CpaE
MARLIAVSIDCRNEEVRRTFEDIASCRRHYLITKGQGTGVADMLLLELDEFRPQHTFDRVRQLLSMTPDLEIFLTGSHMNPQLLLEAFRVGVKEFLPQPLTAQDVEPALVRFEERFASKTSDREMEAGKVVAVFGVRGGVGVSTVATNLAVSVQQVQRHEPVALVDLDVQGGELGLFLDLLAAQGVAHLTRDISRLDETIIRSTLVRHSSGVYFLASGCEAYEEWKSAPGNMMRVLALLRSFHGHVFVDCGHILDPSIREVLDSADQVLVVTTLTLPAIRRTKRLLDVLVEARYPAGKVALVMNRYENDQKDLLEETEAMLKFPISGLIPNDYGSASEALQHGQPLTVVASKTPVGQWYLREVGRLIGSHEGAAASSPKGQAKSQSLLGRYFPSLSLDMRRKPSAV